MKLTVETTQKELEVVNTALTHLINELKLRPGDLAKWNLNQIDLGRIERFRDNLRSAPVSE